jgi:hypothetical protein
VFILLVVLAVALMVSVLLVVLGDKLLQALRRGRGSSAPERPVAGPAPRVEPPPAAPAPPRPQRRRSDGSVEPGARSDVPAADPSHPPRPDPAKPPAGARPTEPVAGGPTPPEDGGSRRMPPSPPAKEEPSRRGRGRRAQPVERLHLQKIEPSTRHRYAQTFQRTSARFAEEPETALSDADKLVTLLMDERGLPVERPEADPTFEGARASLVGDYLAAHAIAEQARAASVTREELEAGMARYQRLVLQLLDDGEGAGAGIAGR